MTRANDRLTQFHLPSMHSWNEPHLPLLPSHTASPHFGRYSFPTPVTVSGVPNPDKNGFILPKIAKHSTSKGQDGKWDKFPTR